MLYLLYMKWNGLFVGLFILDIFIFLHKWQFIWSQSRTLIISAYRWSNMYHQIKTRCILECAIKLNDTLIRQCFMISIISWSVNSDLRNWKYLSVPTYCDIIVFKALRQKYVGIFWWSTNMVAHVQGIRGFTNSLKKQPGPFIAPFV